MKGEKSKQESLEKISGDFLFAQEQLRGSKPSRQRASAIPGACAFLFNKEGRQANLMCDRDKEVYAGIIILIIAAVVIFI